MKWNSKKIAKELLVGAASIFILTNIISYYMSPKLDSEQLPKLDAVLLDGSTFHREEGKPIVIHFWASWCRVCKMEASNIESISKNHQVLTIAVKSGSDAEVKAYMKERGLNFKVLNDTEGIWSQKFKVNAFPTTFIYDSKGELQFTDVGYMTTAGLLARLAVLN